MFLKDATIQAYCWALWKGRNGILFEGKPFNSLVIANDIQSTVYFWACNRSVFGKTISWQDWCCDPRSV